MKIYKLPQLADSSTDGAYFLGQEELKTNGAYMFYARLRPKETGRAISPREGCDEIIFIVKGRLNVRVGKSSFPVSAGEAFLSGGHMVLDNVEAEEAVFIAAGGKPVAVAKSEGISHEAPPVAGPEAKDTKPAQAEERAKKPEDDDFEITAEDAD